MLIGQAEHDTLIVRREDRDNPPGSLRELVSRRLQEVWAPFLREPVCKETLEAMAEAAKMAFVGILPSEVIATFRIEQEWWEPSGVVLVCDDPSYGPLPKRLAVLLPARPAMVAAWGVSEKPLGSLRSRAYELPGS